MKAGMLDGLLQSTKSRVHQGRMEGSANRQGYRLAGSPHGCHIHSSCYAQFVPADNYLATAVDISDLGARLRRLPAALGHAYLLLVVLCLWVVFRADSLSAAGVMLQAMTGLGGAAEPSSLVLTPLDWTALATAALAVAPVWPGFSRWVVTIDALTTSALILVSTSCLYVWRRLARAVLFVIGR